MSVVPADTVVLPFAASVPAFASDCAALTPRFCTAVIEPALPSWPAFTATLPLPPMAPPCSLFSSPVVVIVRPSALSEATRPAVLSRLPAFAASAPAACRVPPRLEIAPETFAVSAPCETIWPFRFDNAPAVSVCAPADVSDPLSFVSVPCALADSVPPAVVFAPARFRSPALAVRPRLPLADVALPARFIDAPESAALPPAAFWPVAERAPPATTVRSPACAIEPSPLIPAPSVPVDTTLFAFALRFCCAASVPLLVRSPAVLTETTRCA
ncbi:hypothetical protein R69658_07956 [Paraburkholderia aspalathi]|uniref:DNA-directed RNA polymerase II subunit RPB1 n=1 Tax=Paraburkholderia aspalathi TaxID=1324617 RepID=A0ABN7NI46_9BURK|nr:hypothetical protein R69658_07956 [Paraburkholderia aspalathi]